MKRRMSDEEYTAAAGSRCPYCRDADVEAVGRPAVDGRDCRQEARCLSCGGEWTDLYRLLGCEARAGGRAKAKAAASGLFLILGDLEPVVFGPYRDGVERDRRARALRREHGDDHGIFTLDVDRAGTPTIGWYSSGFFMGRGAGKR